jgi:hypothetical protein
MSMRAYQNNDWDDLENTSDTTAGNRDRQSYSRASKRMNYHAEAVFAANDKLTPGTIKNISLGGASLAASATPAIGDVVIVSIPFAKKQKQVRRRAVVRWVEGGLFGIEFI